MAEIITVNKQVSLVAEVLSYDDVVGLVYHGCPINFLPVVSFWAISDPKIRGVLRPGDKMRVFTGMIFKVEEPAKPNV
jgi:hypothetical protein